MQHRNGLVDTCRCWIERPGIPFPLFFGHITPEDWENPGSLGR